MAAVAHRARVSLSDRGPGLTVGAAGFLTAVVVGAALALDTPAGLALLIALCYAAIVLIDLRLGLALWVPLIFLEGLYAINLAGKAAGFLLAIAWLGSFRSLREAALGTWRRHRLPLAAVGGLLLWLSLSLLWAEDRTLVFEDLWHWYVLALLFVIVITTVTTTRAMGLVLAAFVVGAVASVVIGVLDGSLTSAVDGAARFQGTAGDPNFLAASLIAATVIAAALIIGARSPIAAVLPAAAAAILVIGLVASGSRGGALAAAATVIAALLLFERRRAQVAAVLAVVLGVAVLAFVNVPGAWDRVTNFDDDNGRSDLWTVASRMGADHPVSGVGLHNYTARSAEYVRDPGSLENVELIVDRPHLVHNTYLSLFAETGVVGLTLFLILAWACLRAAWHAARAFDASGDEWMATLARAVLVAMVSMLAAAFFLSSGTDKRLWLLLALGPALLALAGQARAGRLGPARSHTHGQPTSSL